MRKFVKPYRSLYRKHSVKTLWCKNRVSDVILGGCERAGSVSPMGVREDTEIHTHTHARATSTDSDRDRALKGTYTYGPWVFSSSCLLTLWCYHGNRL